MPLFEYECQECGLIFEVLTQHRDTASRPGCPECGKTNVERPWSPFARRTSEGGGCGTSSFGFG